MFVERRLPHAAGRWADAALTAVGFDRTTMAAGDLRLWVRRQGTDRDVIRNVLLGREYHRPGYAVGPMDVVVDVGANIGAFAVPAARAASGGRVIAVEPGAANHALLADNLARNGCTNAVAVRAAVARDPGTVTMYLDPADASCHSLAARPGAGVESVSGVTLAGLFDEHRIDRCDLLKLDCEGAEYDALYELPAEHRQRIRRCVVEYHADPSHKRARGDELVGWFARSGFRVDHYTDVVGEPVGHVFATRAG